MDSYFGKTAVLKNTRNEQEVECEVDNIRKTDKGVNESLGRIYCKQQNPHALERPNIRGQCSRYGVYNSWTKRI